MAELGWCGGGREKGGLGVNWRPGRRRETNLDACMLGWIDRLRAK
jgi:hypothetical protein